MYRIIILLFAFCLGSIKAFPQHSKKSGIPIIIDADTANEIDDLYAIVRALIAPELNVLAITSAHFRNSPLASDNSVQESQLFNEEILGLMEIDNVDLPIGSNEPLVDENTPQVSPAAEYIIHKAHEIPEGERLHIIVLGPCTNVASALLMDSSIVNKIEVSYIGFWHDQEKETWSRLEFNSGNDIKAVNVLLTVPGLKFNSMTATTSGRLQFSKEVARDNLSGRGGIKSYLFNRWMSHKRWWKKEDPNKELWTMWDVAIIEALINPEYAKTEMLKGPEPNIGNLINVYTDIDIESMKSSFWESLKDIPNKNEDFYLIQNVNIVSASNGTVAEGKDVTVLYGRISSIVNHTPEMIPENATVINGQGKYLMPGLSEMHAHVPVPSEELDESHVQDVMHLYLANGVTLIRGMLGNPYHLELKGKLRNGKIIGPRMYTSSPSMNGNSVPDISSAEEKVREAEKNGYDFLKIHPGIKADVMSALVNTANEVGIGYAGHIPFDVGIRSSIKYGFATVDHVDGYIRGLVPKEENIKSEDVGFFGSGLIKKVKMNRMSALADSSKLHNVWQVPTQSLFTRWFSPISAAEMMNSKEFSYMPANTRYAWRTNKDRMINDEGYTKKGYRRFMRIRKRIIQTLHASGVQFLLGSDSPQVMNVPGFSIHHEIDALKECGLSSYDIIKMGTINPAIFFNQIDRFGTIKVGADADFIIVDQNPFERMETMRIPIGTMIGGKWFDRDYFNEVLTKIEEKHR